MDWVNKAFEEIKQKKARQRFKYSVTSWYAQLREAGYDHEEAREIMRGHLMAGDPTMIPIVMLWVEREGRKE